MAKPKKSAGSGLRKNHGPKRHMFKELKPMSWQFGKLGILDKYNNEESFILACQARGKKSVSHEDWAAFVRLPSKADKDAYFVSIKK